MKRKLPHNPIGWIEIPVKNMERAIKFYEAVFPMKLERHQMGPLDMAWFPMMNDKIGASGSLVKHEKWYKPTLDGILIYFTAFSGDVNNELKKVKKAGGKVWIEKKLIAPGIGYMGVFEDTEGNRIALHSST